MRQVFVGLDWAEDHHDVFVEDDNGQRLGGGRLPEGVEGVARFHELVAGRVDDPADVIVATETDRGLFIGALVAAGYTVLAVNPMSTSRYRERHSTSGAKSDPGDAKVLADLARTDAHNHRPVAGDSELAEAVKVLARAHQTMIWSRQRHTNQLRSTLREFYPAALEAFDELAGRDALAVLTIAPTPMTGKLLSRSKIAAALRRGGRQRRIDERSVEIQTALRTEQLEAPALVTDAMGASVAALVAVIVEMQIQVDRLEAELADRFEQHPDAKVIRSLPGLGMTLGARVLAEFGDDPNRYADAKSRKNYSGMSPITRASGKHHVVLARYARNRRLADACYQWAFATLTASPGARLFYDARRAAGDTHHRALRALANRLVGILHGCLRHHTIYDEHTAWAHRLNLAA
ncbi:MAG: IS110 family transposase [Ilumatobacteraceae bacterium]|nr:IS110 family transposase [Ilumatobacteraceae bacterium]MDW3213305.1 IS110 family transposase [Ilumatobacteraceae bacterium]MDW3214740.1 IS110 family transposase [Ilumatobacteraceae bacterium]MDW3215875.1 IS110 family transposase [Ilumatobacteraceae bacterium]